MADNGQKKKANVRTPSGTWNKMAPKWDLIESLLGGTEVMRAKGETYLPRYEEESANNYANRLARATLLNMTEQILDSLAGKPFAAPIVLSDDVPKEIVDLCEDIDLQGHNLQAFARNWFRVGWAKGFSHVLVEHPTPAEPADGAVRTLADDRQEHLRPFWVHILPENLLAAYAEVDGGEEELVHIRILETSIERQGYEEVLIQKVRVIERDTWELHAPVPDRADEWFLEDSGINPLGFIPLVTFYAGKRESLHECKPPLTDLAHLNITHWQSASDQRNILSVARFPMLAGSGVPDDAKVLVGPNNYLVTEAPEGKWYYVEHSGAAIAAGNTDLEQLKEEMAGYGAEFLKKRPGNEGEGSRKLDSSESSSYLNATVMAFSDAIEQALWITAQWLKQDDGGSVVLSMQAEQDEVNPTEVDALTKARAARDISRFTYCDELQRRGVLAEDYDFEADQEKLASEAPEMTSDMTGGGNGSMDVGKNHPNGKPRFNVAGAALDPNGKPVDTTDTTPQE